MPKPSVGISSSVAWFILLTSLCCILSLSSIDHNGTSDMASIVGKQFVIPRYFPNGTMSVIMFFGIVAMIILIVKRDSLTMQGDHDRMTNHHYLHRRYSLRSIIFFFIPTSILHLNYFIVEMCCLDRWVRCDSDEANAFGVNLSAVIFHMTCIIFAFGETVVCWIMKRRNFKPSQSIYHGLAVVQSANIAIWFDSLLSEAFHHINKNWESFDSYFSFCNATESARNHSNTFCSQSSVASIWFLWSSPFIYPITIEFALLVSENLLGRIIVEEDNNGVDNQQAAQRVRGHANADEQMPLLGFVNNQHRNGDIDAAGRANRAADERVGRPENRHRADLPPAYARQRFSNIFRLIALVVNIFYLVLTILVFVGYKSSGVASGVENELQIFDNVFSIYNVLYDIFSITWCLVGILSCRKFRCATSQTSFLEYLLLFATSGVVLQSIKRIMAFSVHSDPSMFVVYLACAVLDVCQSLLQIVFYYFAKDVKFQPFDNGRRADDPFCVALFKDSLVIVAVNNFFIWISDSFLLPETLPIITPSDYAIDQWPVFDNVVTPLTIFFRFNSVILFSCIGTDIFQPGEMHQD